MIKLSVIIVLYNEYELVKKTLNSIYKNKVNSMEVIVIDNSPKNDRFKSVKKIYPKVKYHQSKENSGFGGGVNWGIKMAKGEFLLILTPDMYLLPNTTKELLAYIESHPKVGLVGGRVFSSPKSQEPSVLSHYPNLITQLYYYNMPFYKFVHRFMENFQPMYKSKKEHKEIIYAKAISGQSIIIRKKAISQIKLFDQLFFLYFEDIDLCKRLNEHNWKVVYIPFGGVVQNGVTSWKKTKITQAHPEYMESNYKFFYKHYGIIYTFAAWIIGAFSALISIPYLILVANLKKTFNKKSQANDLISLWLGITKWHFTKGIRILFH